MTHYTSTMITRPELFFSRIKAPTGCFYIFTRPFRAVFASLLCLGLITFSACACAAGKSETKTADRSKELARQMDPSALELSSEAELLYYYLILADAVSDGSGEEIAVALDALLRLDPSLEVYQDSVTVMLSRGNLAKAEKTAQDALIKYPSDSLLSLLLATVYAETDRIPLAVSLLEKHIAAQPSDTEAVQELIRLYINNGQEEKAAGLISRLPKTDESKETDLFHASVLLTVGRVAEAKALLEELSAKQPDNAEVWLELGYLHEQEKQTGEALKAYHKAAELLPGNPKLQFRIAALYLVQKEPDAAMKALETDALTPETAIDASLRFADAGYHTQAKTLLNKAEALGGNPDQISLINSMLAEATAKDPLQGLPALDNIKPSSTLYPAALQQKARLYITAGNYTEGRRIALDGRNQFPNHKEFWGLEAYALIKQNKLVDAEDLLHQSLKQYPNDEDLLFSLGSVQDEAGTKDKALHTMERILTVNPNNYQALNYVGYTLAEADKDLDRALALITTALRQKPDADYIVDSLAWVQYRLHRYDEAWASIQRCISLGGDDAAIWEHYGDIALALGKKDEAVKGYTESIVRRPDNIDVVRKKLAGLKN